MARGESTMNGQNQYDPNHPWMRPAQGQQHTQQGQQPVPPYQQNQGQRPIGPPPSQWGRQPPPGQQQVPPQMRGPPHRMPPSARPPTKKKISARKKKSIVWWVSIVSAVISTIGFISALAYYLWKY